jgi:hypothetical protein
VSSETTAAGPTPRRRDCTTSNTSDRPRLLGTHVTEASYYQFRVTAAENKMDNNAALREAIDLCFDRKKMPTFA